jgi:hypothetical protein
MLDFWKSLCTPACFPLTTDVFPTQEELSNSYEEYTYTVSISEVNSNFQSRQETNIMVEALLLELVRQRYFFLNFSLAQGFQLVIPPVLKGSFLGVQSKQPIRRHISDPNNSFPYYVSLGDHVHKLFYDISGNNVHVKKYIRKVTYPTEAFNYICAIWPKHLTRYQDRTIEFSYPPLINYNWNYLDHLISGYEEQFTENLRYWRARFILIPLEVIPSSFSNLGEVLDDEEERLAGFKKFIDLFEKARVCDKTEPVKPRRIEIIYTSSSLSCHFRNLSKQPYLHVKSPTKEKLSLNSPFSVISQQMQGINGVSIQNRSWHLHRYEHVFVGEECVDWLVNRFPDIESREKAVEFGNLLLQGKVFEHVSSKHQFLDGFYFYSMCKNDHKQIKEVQSNELGQIIKASSNRVTKQIVLDMDMEKKSTRNEYAVLHYDTIHNPNSCYHFQIHWIMCTARLIEDTLNVWTRMVIYPKLNIRRKNMG